MAKVVKPYGDRILVQRKKIGEKLGSGILHAPDTVAERSTDVAEVVYVPDHTFCDKTLIENGDKIVLGLAKKAEEGDSQAVISLLRLNEYFKIKAIQPGDTLLIGKYVGTDFNIKETGQNLTVLDSDGIYALIVDKG